MVDDAAQAFTEELSLRAEARLSVEPEFSARRPSSVWDTAIFELASQAVESGSLRDGFTAKKFLRVLAAPLAGYRLLAHIVPSGVAVSIRSGYRESLETVTAAATAVSIAATDGADTALPRVEPVNAATPVRRATQNARPAQG